MLRIKHDSYIISYNYLKDDSWSIICKSCGKETLFYPPSKRNIKPDEKSLPVITHHTRCNNLNPCIIHILKDLMGIY